MTGYKDVDEYLESKCDPKFSKMFTLRLNCFILKMGEYGVTEDDALMFLAGYIEGWNASVYAECKSQ